MPALETFIHNVRSLIEQRGLKLTEVAAQIGVSKSYLSIILSNNRKNISDELKEKLATVLGSTVADLYTPWDSSLPALNINTGELNQPPTSRDRLVEKLDYVLTFMQADSRTSLAVYKALAVVNDEEGKGVNKFLDQVLENFRLMNEITGTGRENPVLYQASGFKQIESKLTFDAKMILAHLAVVKHTCPMELLLTILPKEIAVQAERHIEELRGADLIRLQFEEQSVFITIPLESVSDMALGWLTPSRKRNIHHLIAERLASEQPKDFVVLHRIAQHLIEAGDLAQGRDFLLKAQETAFNIGAYAAAKAYLAQLTELSKMLDDQTLKAFSTHQTGLIHFYLGEYLKALDYFKSAIGHYRHIRDRYSLAEIHNAMGATYLAIYDHVNAKKHFLRCLKNLSPDTKTLLRAKLYLNLGTLHWQLNELGRAEEYYTQVLNLGREFQDDFIVAYAKMGQGIVARGTGATALSLEFLTAALDIVGTGSSLVPLILTNLGISYKQAGDQSKACEALLKAFERAKIMQDYRVLTACTVELASFYIDRGEFTMAENWAKQAYEYVEKGENLKYRGNLLHIMGKLAKHKGELSKARDLFFRGIGLLNQINQFSDLKEVYISLASVYELQGDSRNFNFYKSSAEKLATKSLPKAYKTGGESL